MKRLSLLVLIASFSSFAQVEGLKKGTCPEFLLAKKLPAKTFYHPTTLEKITSKQVEFMASVGCIPRAVEKMTPEMNKAVLKAEYDAKLAKIGIK